MRKENGKFEIIYEGNKNKCSISNLVNNNNYEIRISSIYNDLVGEWSKIQKFKTLSLDSVILGESDRGGEFLEKLYEWSGFKRMELLFRGTKDSMTNTSFYNKCENQGSTITLIKNEKGNIFGGYASISWINNNNSTYYSAPESFLFTLTNIYNTEPTKFISKNDQKEIRHFSSYGPVFGSGNDLGICADIQNKGGWSNFSNYTYKDTIGKGRSIFTGDFNNSSPYFKVKEI